MASLHFDHYAAFNDPDAPRTPSPHDLAFANHAHLPIKHTVDLDSVFPSDIDDAAVPLEPQFWLHHRAPPSLLQELYEPDHHHNPQQRQFIEHHTEQPWQHPPQPQHLQQTFVRHSEYPLPRRATFPYVRHDRDDTLALQQYPAPFVQQQAPPNELQYPVQHDHLYPEPLQDAFVPSHQSYEFDDPTASIKLEDPAPSAIVLGPQGMYRAPPAPSQCHPIPMSTYLSPHTGLPVQHTDDAASKETQYLRRRCFNCHTTEPPSWRRSTLNPGKIVCNKCGLYERTHLRPRPLRFDELRAGNKARKVSTAKGSVSPKSKLAHIKKEPREFGIVRRSSVSSISSTQSGSGSGGGGASDWDDSVSVYSSGSTPPTGYNSPDPNTFTLSRDSQSPPRDGGIRLPNAPLSDIASMRAAPVTSPRRPHASPPYYTPPHTADTFQADYFRQEHIPAVKVQPQEPSLWGPSSPTALELPLPSQETVISIPIAVQ